MAWYSPPEFRALAYDVWPAADRAAWEHALRPGDLFDDGSGHAAHWRLGNIRRVQNAYGQWLRYFLSAVGTLDHQIAPAARIVPEVLRAYVAMLRPHCRGTTVLMRVEGAA